VAEYPLHSLDVGTGGHRQARGGVPQLVRHQAVQPHRGGGPVEAGPTEDPVPEHSPAAQAAEDQVVRRPVVQVPAQLVGEEGGEGHRAAFIALGGAPGQHAVDLDDGLGHLDPPPLQVDPLDLERSQLAPAQPAVGQDEHHEAVGGHDLPLPVRKPGVRPRPACLVGEAVHLRVGQIAPAGLLEARQVDPVAGIAR
jgi:hypothetical protein